MIRTHRKVTRRRKHFDWRIGVMLGVLVFAMVAWPGPVICRDYRERSLLKRIDALLLDMASDDETLSSQAVEQLSLCSHGESLRTLLAKLAEREERADSEWDRIESRLDNLWRGIGVDALDELESYLRAESTGYRTGQAGVSLAPQAGRALGAIGEPSLPILMRVLSAGDPTAKRYAAEGLARTGSAEALAPLVTATADPDSGVRSAAVRALGRMGTPGAAAELGRIFSAKAAAAGWAAIELAAMSGSRKPMDYLAVALKDQDPLVRAATAHSLGRIGDTAAMDALATLVADHDASVRKSAVTALGGMVDENAALVAASALTDADEGVREAAITAIRASGRPESLRKYFCRCAARPRPRRPPPRRRGARSIERPDGDRPPRGSDRRHGRIRSHRRRSRARRDRR